MESEQGQGERSPCCCQEDIKSLKCTVELLSVQIEKQSDAFQRKQNELIAGMKLCVRSVALALLTFSQENDDEKQVVGDGYHESTSDNSEQASNPATVDNESLQNPEVATSSDTQTQDNLQDGTSTSPVTNVDDVPVIVSSVSLKNISETTEGATDHVDDGADGNVDFQTIEDEVIAGSVFCQKFEDTNVIFEDELDDSIYVLNDESEEEANQGKKDHADEEKSNHNEATRTKLEPKPTKKGTSPMKCSTCFKCFKSKHYLNLHIRSVHEGVQFKCTYCPGTFSTKGHAQFHEKTVHNVGGPPTQQCKICGIHLINSKGSLLVHMNHKHKRPVVTKKRECASSTRSVTRKGESPLSQVIKQRVPYKKIDHSTKRNQCHLCSKGYAFPSKLKVHIQSAHEGVRHKCTKCPGTFSRLGDVKRHKKQVHGIGGPPTQKCKICGTHLVKSPTSLALHLEHFHKNLRAE